MQLPETTPTPPKIKENTFLLNELFYSFQGEGNSIGQPAIFVRLHLCNLTCEWCDTKYTWDPNHPNFYDYEELEPSELYSRLEKIHCRRLVITGGEPLMHYHQIEALLKFLSSDWQVEIETNGTLPGTPFIRERCQLNVSPKLPSANNQVKAIRPEILKLLAKGENCWFKFVVTGEADFEAMEEVIAFCNLPRERIIVMPEGQTVEALRDHSLLVVERVKAAGYRLLPRLHVLLYGNRRGI